MTTLSDKQIRAIQGFRTRLEEAVDDIEDLAGYAPKYFREKLNIEGTLAKYRAALAGAGESK